MERVESPDEEFCSLTERFFTARLRHHPTWGTVLGRHEYDGALEDYTLEGLASEVSEMKALRLEFEALDPRALSQVHAHDLEWLLATIGGVIETATVTRSLENNPDVYCAGLTESAFSIVYRDFAPPAVRLESLLSRMQAMPGVLRAAEKNLGSPPQVYTEITLEQLAGNRDFFDKTLLEAFAGQLDTNQVRALNDARREVLESFDRFSHFLSDTVLPRSTGDFAIGADAFSRKLYHDELIECPLEHLLAMGEADLRKNQAEFRRLAATFDRDASPAQVMMALGRQHVPPERLLMTTEAMLDDIRGFITQNQLLTLPPAEPLRVVETPPFMRATVSAAMDTPGPFEKVSREAYYYMTLPNPAWPKEEQSAYMAQWTEAGISNLSVHEAYPGHYVQFLLLPQFPSLARRMMWTPSNAEGWAHYCETMMLEQGFRGNMPQFRMAMLQDALLRNARLVAGIRLHTQGMSVAEAQAFFEREAFLARPVAQSEAWRGTLDPTYGYYTLGKLMLMKLRADYAEQAYPHFSLQKFHDEFLAQGPAPMPLVREALLGTREGLL